MEPGTVIFPLQARAAAPVDLDAYFARIGYRGPRTPTLATLRALHALHPAAIPFENIDVLLGRGVDIAPAAVDAKLIAGRRGGYCFEQNSLFRRVLEALGFQVEGLVARVLWLRPADAALPARTHMVLRVTLDRRAWLADVGFGTCVPTSPLRMDTDAPQRTAHESFRLLPRAGGLLLEARRDGAWLPVYLISPEPQVQADYEMANWFTMTHPSSHFRHGLIVTRVTPQARHALANRRLTVRPARGRPQRHDLTPEQVEHALRETFGLPVEPGWGAMIGELVAYAA